MENRKHIATEFLSKYGKDLTEQQRTALSKLGKGIIKEDLNRSEVARHKNKMQTLIRLFKN